MNQTQIGKRVRFNIADLVAQQPLVVGDSRFGFMAVEAAAVASRDERIAIAWCQDYKAGYVGTGKYACYSECVSRCR